MLLISSLFLPSPSVSIAGSGVPYDFRRPFLGRFILVQVIANLILTLVYLLVRENIDFPRVGILADINSRGCPYINEHARLVGMNPR